MEYFLPTGAFGGTREEKTGEIAQTRATQIPYRANRELHGDQNEEPGEQCGRQARRHPHRQKRPENGCRGRNETDDHGSPQVNETASAMRERAGRAGHHHDQKRRSLRVQVAHPDHRDEGRDRDDGTADSEES